MQDQIPNYAQTLGFARVCPQPGNFNRSALDAFTFDLDGNVDTEKPTDTDFSTCVKTLRKLQCSMLAVDISESTRYRRFRRLLRESAPGLKTSSRAFGAGVVLTETWLKRCRPDIAHEGYEYDYPLPPLRRERVSKQTELDSSARSGRGNMASESTLLGGSHYPQLYQPPFEESNYRSLSQGVDEPFRGSPESRIQPKAAHFGDDGLQLWRYLLIWRCTGGTATAKRDTQAVVSKSMSEWGVQDIEYILPELAKLIKIVGSLKESSSIRHRLQTSLWRSYTKEELVDTLRETSRLIDGVKCSLTITAQAQSDKISQSDGDNSPVVPTGVEDRMIFPLAHGSLQSVEYGSTSL